MSRAGKIIHEDAEVMHATIPDVFSQLSGSNILVTGACGFLGSFIVDILSALNHSSPSLNANIVACRQLHCHERRSPGASEGRPFHRDPDSERRRLRRIGDGNSTGSFTAPALHRRSTIGRGRSRRSMRMSTAHGACWSSRKRTARRASCSSRRARSTVIRILNLSRRQSTIAATCRARVLAPVTTNRSVWARRFASASGRSARFRPRSCVHSTSTGRASVSTMDAWCPI